MNADWLALTTLAQSVKKRRKDLKDAQIAYEEACSDLQAAKLRVSDYITKICEDANPTD